MCVLNTVMALHGSIVDFDELQKGRANKNMHAWFIENFGAMVVGQDKFRSSAVDNFTQVDDGIVRSMHLACTLNLL